MPDKFTERLKKRWQSRDSKSPKSDPQPTLPDIAKSIPTVRSNFLPDSSVGGQYPTSTTGNTSPLAGTTPQTISFPYAGSTTNPYMPDGYDSNGKPVYGASSPYYSGTGGPGPFNPYQWNTLQSQTTTLYHFGGETEIRMIDAYLNKVFITVGRIAVGLSNEQARIEFWLDGEKLGYVPLNRYISYGKDVESRTLGVAIRLLKRYGEEKLPVSEMFKPMLKALMPFFAKSPNSGKQVP